MPRRLNAVEGHLAGAEVQAHAHGELGRVLEVRDGAQPLQPEGVRHRGPQSLSRQDPRQPVLLPVPEPRELPGQVLKLVPAK